MVTDIILWIQRCGYSIRIYFPKVVKAFDAFGINSSYIQLIFFHFFVKVRLDKCVRIALYYNVITVIYFICFIYMVNRRPWRMIEKIKDDEFGTYSNLGGMRSAINYLIHCLSLRYRHCVISYQETGCWIL